MACGFCLECSNTRFSCAGWPSTRAPTQSGINTRGREKMMFGTEFPTIPWERARDEIDARDPIYQNRWRIESVNATRFVARDQREAGQTMTARKVPDGFKLPTK